MDITNQEKSAISFRHQKDIQRLFYKHVKGSLCIDHFSLNIFFGNENSIFLSPTPSMAKELCDKNLVDSDSNYCPSVYKKASYYPWKAVQKNETDSAINMIKEEKYGMRNGFMIVRNLGCGVYVMYSVATHKKDNPEFPGQFSFLYHCKANYIAEMGDYLFNNLRFIIGEYALKTGVCIPEIKKFQPIGLDSAFNNDTQREMFEISKGATGIDLLKRIEKEKSPILQLVNAGILQ